MLVVDLAMKIFMLENFSLSWRVILSVFSSIIPNFNIILLFNENEYIYYKSKLPHFW